MIEQIAIAVLGLTGIALIAFNRIFVGCVFSLVTMATWCSVAYRTEQWGALALLTVYAAIYFIGIVLRWPRTATLAGGAGGDLPEDDQFLGIG